MKNEKDERRETEEMDDKMAEEATGREGGLRLAGDEPPGRPAPKRTRTKMLNEDLEERVEDLARQIKAMNFKVGKDEFERTVTQALVEEAVDIGFRLTQLEHATYDAWEIRAESIYVTEAQKWKQTWQRKCAESKGTKGSNVGGVKNYVLLGLVNAYLMDDDTTKEDKKYMKDVVLRICADGRGEVVPTKVKLLHEIVSHATVTVVKKADKAYINLCVRGSQERIKILFRKALDAAGKRQWDPPPLKPRTRDLREAITWRKDTRGAAASSAT
jgi:hypothetical protein